eukprot:TRINITY_DN9244_c0_g1::TRINITY_DN9244_c0_g1_i1::g.13293::m.13293 TRINITY_DN9244_c0_g1::TRINITY_DN9244_c0_g1_i1::g.13293  ORF type:complete len:113 (-),score=-16.35,Asp_Glu_race/PF01177.17/0.013 TRINITY_DN9244_c0_g1_i1:18-356(-)
MPRPFLLLSNGSRSGAPYPAAKATFNSTGKSPNQRKPRNPYCMTKSAPCRTGSRSLGSHRTRGNTGPSLAIFSAVAFLEAMLLSCIVVCCVSRHSLMIGKRNISPRSISEHA